MPMMNKYRKKSIAFQPSQFNKVASFGKNVTYEDENTGMTRKGFKELFTLHYRNVKRTVTQQYSLLGTELENTKIIMIQHNDKVDDTMLVTIDGQQYNVVSIEVDESNVYLKYDYLTIKATQKGR